MHRTHTADLPIHSVLPELIDTLRENPAVVLTAPPGAGKSTVVPLAMLEAGVLRDGGLVMLEPRRIAARASADRMATLMGEAVGETVGYRIRFDRRESAQTRILVVTEGILTRWLVSDPFLDGISLVILDEFHERSVHIDLALAFLLELTAVREDLRIVVMSATMDAARVSRFLNACPIIECSGARFPVTVTFDDASRKIPLVDRAEKGARQAIRQAPDAGDVLVFMPGAGEIRRLETRLREAPFFSDVEVVPLFGALSHQAQDRALNPKERRRIVIATNIAETSLTIPRVTAVVDSGLKKEIRFDPGLGLDRLETTVVSADSATQRAGRAGRLGEGWVLRLWQAHEDKGRPMHDVPEIQRVDAAPVLLQIMAFHPGDPRQYPLLDAPEPRLATQGLELLIRLGAVDSETLTLTEKGAALAGLPVHPRLGALLLWAAENGAASLGASLAALLSERDILHGEGREDPHDGLDIDFDYRLDLLEHFEKEGANRETARRLGISCQGALFVLKAKAQLLAAIGETPPRKNRISVTPGQLLLAGFPDRLIRLNSDQEREGVMVGGRGIRLAATPPEHLKGTLFIAVRGDAGQRTERARGKVYQISPVTTDDLTALHPSLVTHRRRARFDRTKGGVVTEQALCFLDLVLETSPSSESDPYEVAELLADAAAERWDRVFKPSKAAVTLIARVRYAGVAMPSLALPDVSEAGLKKMLTDICFGKRYLSEISSVNWRAAVAGQLSFPMFKKLDELFPERWEVPSGRAVPIDYEAASLDPGKTPILACRLQELFGLMDTPAIADGRIPLTVHLLAPNGRPCQVTQDLKSFWERTYADVRKDLRGRYPKHYWPEDPFTATPTQRARPKLQKNK